MLEVLEGWGSMTRWGGRGWVPASPNAGGGKGRRREVGWEGLKQRMPCRARPAGPLHPSPAAPSELPRSSRRWTRTRGTAEPAARPASQPCARAARCTDGLPSHSPSPIRVARQTPPGFGSPVRVMIRARSSPAHNRALTPARRPRPTPHRRHDPAAPQNAETAGDADGWPGWRRRGLSPAPAPRATPAWRPTSCSHGRGALPAHASARAQVRVRPRLHDTQPP